MVSPYNKVPHVAPLAGSVDRNLDAAGGVTVWVRRSPRGERG